jgi:CheY-like chemotaxis protein
MILDLSLPDMSGFELLNRIHADDNLPKCPIIVYTGKDLSEDENQELLKYVDDDARNAFALSKLLTNAGVKVHIAPNATKAFDLLDRIPIDLILMDIMLPGMDGYEATRHIRSQPRFARLPILALTAKAMAGDREKCLAAGANDYISKPIDADRLFSMLRVWLTRG